eukprot:27722_1
MSHVFISFLAAFYLLNLSLSANPDGSCTNPKFRWFKDLNAFHNYTASINSNATIPAERVNISLTTNARCLDGSQYFFYFRQGFGDGIHKYQIYLQGGGWCTSYQSCAARAQPSNYVGSSLHYTPYAWYSADYLDDNQTNNPLMYNWNTIWMIYCDGSSFTGNNLTVYSYKGQNLYFRGHHNLKQGMTLLYDNYGLHNASDVVLSGCSAGGMAVYLNNDYIFKTFVNQKAKSRFLSIAQSGFFPYNNPIHNSAWHDAILWIYNTQNVTHILNSDCVNYYDHQNNVSNCMFPQYVSPFLNKNKVFALQSIYDAAGMSEQGINANDIEQSNEYGQWYAELFFDQFINMNSKLHGALLYSCHSHCGEYNHINVSGVVSANAIQMFYYQNHTETLVFQNHSYPCTECCFPLPTPPTNVSVCRYNNELCDPNCM